MEEAHPPESDMTQRIINPDGIDDTAAYVSEMKQVLRECLRTIHLTIARRSFLREQNIAEGSVASATDCFNRYFQSMKGQTNISTEMIEQFVRDEVHRQEQLYRGLSDLKTACTDNDVSLEVLPPENVYCEPAWSSDLSFGTTLRIQTHSFLIAFPPVTLRTNYYMALNQEPVAADIIAVTDRIILLQPAGQDIDDAALETFSRLFGDREEITSEVSGAYLAFHGSGYLLIDSDRNRTDDELSDLRVKYNVPAVVTADSSRYTATLWIKDRHSTENLKRETGLV